MLFPSYLKHFVLPNKNDSDRISMSFDLTLVKQDATGGMQPRFSDCWRYRGTASNAMVVRAEAALSGTVPCHI